MLACRHPLLIADYLTAVGKQKQSNNTAASATPLRHLSNRKKSSTDSQRTRVLQLHTTLFHAPTFKIRFILAYFCLSVMLLCRVHNFVAMFEDSIDGKYNYSTVQ